MTKDNDERVYLCIYESEGNPGGFDDNVHGTCDVCGAKIIWRPHAVGGHVCRECFIKDARQGKIHVVEVTQRAAYEYLAWTITKSAARRNEETDS